MHRLGPIEILRATWALATLAVATRGRLRGRYWTWRVETALGTDPTRRPPLRTRVAMMLHYGAWVARMRRVR